MRRSVFSSIAAFVIVVSPLAAQSEAPALHELTVGSPLKVTADDGRGTVRTGIFAGVAADTVRLLHRRETIGFPVASVRQIEVSRGRNRGKGWAYGAGIGGLALGASYAGLMLGAGEPGYARDGAPAMIVIGAFIGGLVGLDRAPRRWEVVSLQPGPR
jgi:hypothetical protein